MRASRAPSGPPLGGGPASGEDEQTGGVPSAGGDQLVENGLASPLCKGAIRGRLSSAAQSNCRTSGFVGAPAPTNDYALDVHIDTGAFGVSKGELLSVVQDLFIAPAWGAVEWVVHALVVMLEWCYSLELLGGPSAGTIATALRQARTGFTDPWLALVLAVASMLALYHGLVRRRVAETLGGALSAFAMMAGGLWVIADPLGTVGAVGQWANQASLGTLGVTASGTPADGAGTLGEGMRALFAGAIELPWCYLEFGNVRWCSDPAQLDPRLRKAALAILAHRSSGCRPSTGACAADTTPEAISHGDELVRTATSNGSLFLAFPANGPERNSINESGSLLRAICQSEDATKCTGPAAAEAEFRTDGGTFPRVLGLLAVAIGVLGLTLLFGLIALRLLAAAFLSLFMLLLAPFAVLAPALGDGGRAVFCGWATRLLGAVTSKLLFSFVLGALLTMQRLLFSLGALGWWTQWLLISAFWWSVFLKRHQAAAVLRGAASARTAAAGPARGRAAGHTLGHSGSEGPSGRERWPLVRRAERSLQAYGAIRHPRRWAQARLTARLAPERPPGEERLEPRQFEPRQFERSGNAGDGRPRPDGESAGDANSRRGDARSQTGQIAQAGGGRQRDGQEIDAARDHARARGSAAGFSSHSDGDPGRPAPRDRWWERGVYAAEGGRDSVHGAEAGRDGVRGSEGANPDSRGHARAHGGAPRGSSARRSSAGEGVGVDRGRERTAPPTPSPGRSESGRPPAELGRAEGVVGGVAGGHTRARESVSGHPRHVDGVSSGRPEPERVAPPPRTLGPRKTGSRVLDDVFAVAEGRKRQLGYGSEE
jgi:hypothetical protein